MVTLMFISRRRTTAYYQRKIRFMRELVREDVDALLFSPNDPEDLARQVLRLWNDLDLSKRLADAATESALTKFTWHEAQKKLVKVYDRLLG